MTRRQQRKAKKVQARQRRLRNERHISLTLAAQQRKATREKFVEEQLALQGVRLR